MPKVDLYNLTGKAVGSVELSETVFGLEPHQSAMHQVVVAQLANRRQGTQSALTRSEVSGGGKKPWRQKGTGRARQGSTRAPQWRHGGMVRRPRSARRGWAVIFCRAARRHDQECRKSHFTAGSGRRCPGHWIGGGGRRFGSARCAAGPGGPSRRSARQRRVRCRRTACQSLGAGFAQFHAAAKNSLARRAAA